MTRRQQQPVFSEQQFCNFADEIIAISKDQVKQAIEDVRAELSPVEAGPEVADPFFIPSTTYFAMLRVVRKARPVRGGYMTSAQALAELTGEIRDNGVA